MLHRVQREIDARHRPHFARPKPACVHHMLGMHRAFFGDNIPCAIAALRGGDNLAMRLDRGAAHLGGARIGMGCARRVQMPVQRIVKPAHDPVQIGDRRDFCNLFRTDDLGFQPHVAVLGPFRDQHVEPLAVIRQRDATHVMQAAGHARDRFKLFIETDRITLKRGHVGVAVQRVKPARRVPCAAACQFRAFDQHHVGPAQLGQVIQHRTADNAAADHGYSGSGLHESIPRWYSARVCRDGQKGKQDHDILCRKTYVTCGGITKGGSSAW